MLYWIGIALFTAYTVAQFVTSGASVMRWVMLGVSVVAIALLVLDRVLDRGGPGASGGRT